MYNAEGGFVVDSGNSSGYGFLYFFYQVVQLGFTQRLEEGCVLRFHDFYINVFIKILKGAEDFMFPVLIPFDNTKMGYYLVLCNT
jgi:hypothetical protein